MIGHIFEDLLKIFGITGSSQCVDGLRVGGRERNAVFSSCCKVEKVFVADGELEMQHQGQLRKKGGLFFRNTVVLCAKEKIAG